MRVRFNEVSPHGNQFNVTEIEGFAEDDILSFHKEVESTFSLKRKGENKVVMAGNLSATPVVTCDRCLTTYNYSFHVEFHILFELDENSWDLKEVKCSSSDLEIVVLDEPVIDIKDVLRQQVLLQLPEKKTCSRDCKGICCYCGINLNEASCDCKLTNHSSSFADALSKLNRK